MGTIMRRGCFVLAATIVMGATPSIANANPARHVLGGSMPRWDATPIADPVTSTPISIDVVLPVRDARRLEELAHHVADPHTAEYRHFVSPSEFRQRFSPTSRQAGNVAQFLRGAGLHVEGISSNRLMVRASGRSDQVARAFGVHLRHYRFGNSLVWGPDRPLSVPAALTGDISTVIGLDQSTNVHTSHRHQHAVPTVGDTHCARWWGEHNNTAVPQAYPGRQSNAICGYTGRALADAYGAGQAPRNGSGATIAILDAYAAPHMVDDADTYFHRTGVPAFSPGAYQEHRPTGTPSGQCGTAESWNEEEALDVEAAHSAAPAARIVYWGSRDCTTLEGTLNDVVADGSADVISNSWGQTGEAQSPDATAAVDTVLQEAAVQGQTVLFSSGDSGDNSADHHRPSVDFPTSSPWATAIGGTTTALNRDAHPVFETGWESALSQLDSGTWSAPGVFAGGAGGGSSALFDKPTWQPGTQQHRLVPDIAADADPATGMLVAFTPATGSRQWPTVGGTSLACPLIAGILADAGGHLGLVAPSLYPMLGTSAIRDVTHVPSGISERVDQHGTARDVLLRDDEAGQSLRTAAGYDQVTGVGVPNGAPFFVALSHQP